ncbi:MAG: exodeoxyribonuclease VII large subunit [Gammaproteobacteria bacterium]|nr:exodeoxyribonuclease VII large subunit [Gammaproteobacteria bacterium]
MDQEDALNTGRNEPVLRVSEVNATVRELLRDTFPLIYIEGEVSGLTKHRSGHWYFTLKDDRASMRCVMFASNARRIRSNIDDGDLVRIRAELSLYEARGDFQAVAKHIEPVGEGALRQAFEELRAKLLALGWFDDSLKKTLPAFPKVIAVVSSPEGDALRDVFTNIYRRFPIVELVLEPTAVQGQAAIREICEALKSVNAMDPLPDLAILTRGGGSLEDLYVFNSEQVARAIYESDVPIVSAVGHEADYTISDYCADLRAPTPSTAAELVTPDAREISGYFSGFEQRLAELASGAIIDLLSRTTSLESRMRDPREKLVSWNSRVSDSKLRLRRTIQNIVKQRNLSVSHSEQLLFRQSPSKRISEYGIQLSRHRRQLVGLARSNLERLQAEIASVGRNLHAVSPLAVLDRGFAVVAEPDESEFGQVVRKTSDVEIGADIDVHLIDGTLHSEVKGIAKKHRE